MSLYDDLYNLRYERTGLRNRVVVGVARAALDVLAESTATPNHAARLAWAKNALRNTVSVAEDLVWGVVGDATVRTKELANPNSATDAEIQAAVNASINNFAAGV